MEGSRVDIYHYACGVIKDDNSKGGQTDRQLIYIYKQYNCMYFL